MMFSLLALAVIPAALVQALPANTTGLTTTYGTATSITSNIQCKTQYALTSVAPTPLETATTTIQSSTTTLMNATTYPSTVYKTGTPTPYTTTTWTNVYATGTYTPGVYTSVTFVYETSTLATYTETASICTNAVTPCATSTVYTGTYSGGPTGVSSIPIYVNCTDAVTTFYKVYPTVTSGVKTITYTPATIVATITSTSTYTRYTNLPQSSTTITSSGTSFVADKTTTTISTACAETETKTYHAKCAPTNLIGSIDGNGIHQITNAPGTANVLTGGNDPSVCCQACVDSEGCAAMFSYPAAGNCDLVFSNPANNTSPTFGNSTEATCGLAFTYSSDGQTGGPNSGFIVQAGCGTISASS